MQTSTLPALSRGPLTKRSVPLVQLWTAVAEETFSVTLMKNYIKLCFHVVTGQVYLSLIKNKIATIKLYTVNRLVSVKPNA